MAPRWLREARYAPPEPRRETWTKRLIIGGLFLSIGLIVAAINSPRLADSILFLRLAQTAAVLSGLVVVYFVAMLSSEKR